MLYVLTPGLHDLIVQTERSAFSYQNRYRNSTFEDYSTEFSMNDMYLDRFMISAYQHILQNRKLNSWASEEMVARTWWSGTELDSTPMSVHYSDGEPRLNKNLSGTSIETTGAWVYMYANINSRRIIVSTKYTSVLSNSLKGTYFIQGTFKTVDEIVDMQDDDAFRSMLPGSKDMFTDKAILHKIPAYLL